MDNVVEFAKSELGTKQYWDHYYDRDLSQLDDGGDGGDTWYVSQSVAIGSLLVLVIV